MPGPRRRTRRKKRRRRRRQSGRENHDLRFDIPCLGPQTLETCAAGGFPFSPLKQANLFLLEQELCETDRPEK